LRDRIINNRVRANGYSEKTRKSEIQKANMMMLEKMYKIQNRSTSKKNLQKRKPIYFNFNDPNQFILYGGSGGNEDF